MKDELQKIADELDAMPKGGDEEGLHDHADNLLCEALRILGADNVADAFEQAKWRVGFWYA